MKLAELLEYSDIAIQCHDNPDADALASGLGLYLFFMMHGKQPLLFYSGPNCITKPNLAAMVQLLDIPIQHLPSPPLCELLVTVDCRHGSGNVSMAEAECVCVIDHHLADGPLPALHDVRPYLASCSTLVWRLLLDEGMHPDPRLVTALYYGLLTDSQHFKELSHPLDRDLRDVTSYDKSIVTALTHCNLALADLQTTAAGLQSLIHDRDGKNLVVAVPSCDPNILGFIGDLVMQVDGVDFAVVFADNPDEIKFSVRSITREVKASHLTAWIVRGIGSGGGLADKAGGRINRELMFRSFSGETVREFFRRKITAFIQDFSLLDCAAPSAPQSMAACKSSTAFADFAAFSEYRKKPVQIAYVAGLFTRRTRVHIRMLEGDIALDADSDTYFMIGLEGGVYPISRTVFETIYSPNDRPAHIDAEYSPVLLDMEQGTRIKLELYAQSCTALGGGRVRAVRLTGGLRLFTHWDKESYMLGDPGDWLVMRDDAAVDWYIVKDSVFPALYEDVHDA